MTHEPTAEERRFLILRKVTRTVKIFPFVYTALLLALSPFEAWLSLKLAQIIGLLTFTAIPSVWLCWRLSKAIRLCHWHRAQCLLTLLPMAIPLCRILCANLSIVYVWSGIAIILIASLINCYLVFIKTQQK